MTFPRKKEKNIFDQIGTYLFSRVFLLITKTFFSKLPCKFVKHFDVDIYVTTQNGKMHQLYELSEREKFCLNFSGCNQHLAIAHGQIVFEIKFFLVLNLFCSGVTRGTVTKPLQKLKLVFLLEHLVPTLTKAKPRGFSPEISIFHTISIFLTLP